MIPVKNSDPFCIGAYSMARDGLAGFFASPPSPGETYESVLRGNREWALMPRQERSRLLEEARRKDRRIRSLANAVLRAKSVDLSALGEMEVPYLPRPGETDDEATRRKVEEDALRWPVEVKPSPQPPSFVIDLTGAKAGTVYVIQDLRTGLFKIGRTTNMKERMKALGVGKTARLIQSKRVADAAAVERAAHRRYRAQRLPQTEYFRLGAPPSI